MNLSNVSLRSLYMLRDNDNQSVAGQFDPRARKLHGYPFSHTDLAAIAAPSTPGWPKRESVFGGRSAPPAGIFHMGSLGSIPRIRGLEAGALPNLSAFAVTGASSFGGSIGGAPGLGNTPYPSFGPVNPNAQSSPGAPDQPNVSPVPGRAIGFVPPTPQTTPPIQNIPTPVPTQPSTGLGTGALVVGGLVLAFLFLGTQDKKGRRRRA